MAKSGWDWNLFRLAVIEAGIRGELTADWRAANPDVEPAHALLERIAEEKAELIRTKQIPKGKPLPPINPEEMPFDIPDTWECMRMNDACELWNGRAYKKHELLEKGPTKVLRVGNFFTNDKYFYSDLDLEPQKYCETGDLLYAWSASFGPRIWEGGKVIYHYHIWKVQCFESEMKKYLYWFFEYDVERVKSQQGRGDFMLHVTKAAMSARMLPLPPAEEQKEIVRILSALDRGESDGPVHPLVARIQKLEKEFRALAGEYESQEKWLSDLRSALLQEAISGELTSDWRAANPDVEPADALLERIAEEKAELIRTKQIRKEKPLPPLHSDEIAFDVPESWEWTRLDAVSCFRNGKAHEQHFNPNGKFALVNARLVSTGGVVSRRCDVALTPLFCDEIALVMSDVPNGRALSRAFLVPRDGQFTLNQRVAGITPRGNVVPLFLARVLDRNASLLAYDNGHRQTHLRKDAIRECPIALPPVDEQLEISHRLEMQLEKLDALKLELEQSKEAGQLLMKSKLANVFKKKTPLVKSVLNG